MAKEKRPVGQPPVIVIDDKILNQIETLSGYGLTKGQISAVLGISHDTFTRRLNDDPRISACIEAGKAKAAASVTQTAFKMAQGGKSAPMTQYWLNVREGWKETKVIESKPTEESLAEISRLVIETLKKD